MGKAQKNSSKKETGVTLLLFLAGFFLMLPFLLSGYTGYTGKLLIASERNKAPAFEKSVIYIYAHNSGGAKGVILNRPGIPEDLKTSLFEAEHNIALYEGGPVDFPNAKISVMKKGEALSVIRQDNLETILPKGGSKTHDIYLGYAGWFSGQLELEVLNGAWIVEDYDPDSYDTVPIAELWNHFIEKN